MTEDEQEIMQAAYDLGVDEDYIKITPLGRFMMSANAKTFTAPNIDYDGVLEITNSHHVFLIDATDTGLVFAVCHHGKQKRYYLTSIGGGRPYLKGVKRKHGTVSESEDWLRKKGRL